MLNKAMGRTITRETKGKSENNGLKSSEKAVDHRRQLPAAATGKCFRNICKLIKIEAFFVREANPERFREKS